MLASVDGVTSPGGGDVDRVTMLASVDGVTSPGGGDGD